MTLVVALAGAQLVEVQLRTNTAVAQVANVAEASGSCFGAAAIVRGTAACPPDPRGPMVPEPALAANDRPDAYRDECWVDFPFTDRTICTYGSGPLRVALVGNSHAGQWLPTLQVLAEEHGWTLTTYVSLQCNVTAAELAFNTPEKIAGCLDYGRWVMDQTTADPFDMVITTERQSVPTKGDTIATTLPHAIVGYTGYLDRWLGSGAKVVVLEDTPYPWQVKRSIPDCLAQHPDERDICNGTPAAWYSIDPLYEAARQSQAPGVTTVPTRAWFCTANLCPAVIGNVIVYFDGSHMTATYARTLAPELWRPIEAALGRPSGSPAP
jgi:hypothetical protein